MFKLNFCLNQGQIFTTAHDRTFFSVNILFRKNHLLNQDQIGNNNFGTEREYINIFFCKAFGDIENCLL